MQRRFLLKSLKILNLILGMGICIGQAYWYFLVGQITTEKDNLNLIVKQIFLSVILSNNSSCCSNDRGLWKLPDEGAAKVGLAGQRRSGRPTFIRNSYFLKLYLNGKGKPIKSFLLGWKINCSNCIVRNNKFNNL